MICLRNCIEVAFTRNLFYKGQLEFQLVLSLIFRYTFLTAFGHKRLVSYLAVPYSLSLIKHTVCISLGRVTRAKMLLFANFLHPWPWTARARYQRVTNDKTCRPPTHLSLLRCFP